MAREGEMFLSKTGTTHYTYYVKLRIPNKGRAIGASCLSVGLYRPVRQ